MLVLVQMLCSILHLDSDGATVLTIESDNDNNDEGDEAAIHLLTDGGFLEQPLLLEVRNI